MNKYLKYLSYLLFLVVAILGVHTIFNAKFVFDFEDFFPQNDPDLEYFLEFVAEFDTDDNFYLIGLENSKGIFDQQYLQKVDSLTRALKTVDNIDEAISLTSIVFPVMTPMGILPIPAVNVDKPELYEQSKKSISEDERLMKKLVSEDFSSSIINLKIIDSINLETSNQLVRDVDSVVQSFHFEEVHYLGRANFQKEMIEMSAREIVKSSAFAGLFVLLIMIYIFRRRASVLLTMSAIGLAMLGFLAYMGVSGQPFNPMSGLYPILMIIVSTSDVIHLLTKYIDELRIGKSREEAIKVTIKDIGMATLLTSITTSVGFATLLFSRLQPIQQFGINAAAGVMVAFGIILLFCWITFPMFDLNQLSRDTERKNGWEVFLENWYRQTLRHPKRIFVGIVLTLILSGIGISMITTNYKLESNLPLNAKITEDYKYFEKEYAGFRPLEIAVTASAGHEIDEYAVMSELNKIEDYVKQFEEIDNVVGHTMVYKSINKMMNGNQTSGYVFPPDEATFNEYSEMAKSVPKISNSLLVSRDGQMSRISTRIDDIGAEKVQERVQQIENWISENTDPDLATYKITGTAMILDKNMFYVRESLLKGLGFAILIVSLLMVILFKNIKLLIISILPNLFPLLTSAAIIGFLGIELEAGIAIVFAIAFGIAVDDTIHFLSKYKLERAKGKSVEDSIHTTFLETGKAIILTSIILFGGFMVMFFSIHPPSRSIGILIAVTLIAALVADLYMIPGLIRYLVRSDKKGARDD